jgi:hypothetical protein
MSHFTTIKTKIVEREHLLKALQDLGYKFEVGDLSVRGDMLNSTPVEVRVSPGWLSHAIGFRKRGETYDCVADWSGVRGVKRDAFFQQLNQRYAYHATRAKLEAQGFAIAEEKQEENGRVHLVLRRVS